MTNTQNGKAGRDASKKPPCNPTVAAIGQLARDGLLRGNLVPDYLYGALRDKTGKPYWLAIGVMAEIIYWHRPTKDGDKKFHGGAYNLNRGQLAEKFGVSKWAISSVLTYLVKQGLIVREHKDEPINGRTFRKMVYVTPVAKKLLSLGGGPRPPTSVAALIGVEGHSHLRRGPQLSTSRATATYVEGCGTAGTESSSETPKRIHTDLHTVPPPSADGADDAGASWCVGVCPASQVDGGSAPETPVVAEGDEEEEDSPAVVTLRLGYDLGMVQDDDLTDQAEEILTDYFTRNPDHSPVQVIDSWERKTESFLEYLEYLQGEDAGLTRDLLQSALSLSRRFPQRWPRVSKPFTSQIYECRFNRKRTFILTWEYAYRFYFSSEFTWSEKQLSTIGDSLRQFEMYTHRDLMVMAIQAWMLGPPPGEDYDPFWHCRPQNSKFPNRFFQFLPDIEHELERASARKLKGKARELYSLAFSAARDQILEGR